MSEAVLCLQCQATQDDLCDLCGKCVCACACPEPTSDDPQEAQTLILEEADDLDTPGICPECQDEAQELCAECESCDECCMCVGGFSCEDDDGEDDD